jgi:hypothetical protein
LVACNHGGFCDTDRPFLKNHARFVGNPMNLCLLLWVVRTVVEANVSWNNSCYRET